MKAEYDRAKQDNGYAGSMNFLVKAGQVIGRIGGQTLDFAVWDTEKPLTGFIVPEHYQAEFWKIYTANPYDYFADDVKALLIERNPRIVDPIEGKIDYDLDGKLIGNWFVEDTNGYMGNNREEYWSTHLAVAPDHYDPSKYIISIGNFNNEAQQFSPVEADFDAKNIGLDSGIVKVNLAQFSYVDENGNGWLGDAVIKGPKLQVQSNILGCALFQLIEDRKLNFEAFPKQNCDQVSGFSNQARVYER